MKIHGKILNHYLTCSAPVVKEGYLYKKGEVNTSYQKRWVTLKGNLLFYQDRPRDREVLGVIVLEGCSVQLCESDEQFAFSLVFSEAGLRTYKFSAENQTSQELWVKAIHSAHHNFLSILLKDLRQQYLEAAKAVGVEPVDCSRLTKETMAHSQKLYLGSVFYAEADMKGLGGPGNNQLLQVPPTAAKHAGKRSPKLWPKRQAHVTPVSGPAPPLGEWSEPTEDFSTMHEEFGKEVRRLVAEWRRRGKEVRAVPEGDLIDLG
ncbi:sesquipedalian-1 isoform X1 [Astyanax mexicanus]|uniref:sesquipedalian-1 isoform X1 n=1 Tax=Astyanax mexicanus TaxID=7994 RepID=UPI0020CAF0A1|nr:sesquipedalian-1 isoform X1 [Astyanax mexicanus]XP_022525088.2 sesquipedalian-1 isoform X1 [Astyanax mexicanus]